MDQHVNQQPRGAGTGPPGRHAGDRGDAVTRAARELRSGPPGYRYAAGPSAVRAPLPFGVEWEPRTPPGREL